MNKKLDSNVPTHLPGELSAEDVLNGVYPFPPSPEVEFHQDWAGFDKTRLSPVPPPGVHPRILLSPEDLPGLRRRLKETQTGQTLYKTLQGRLATTIGQPGTYHHDLYELLATGDINEARRLIDEKQALPSDIGHYQPFVYALALEAFDAMVTENVERGKRVGLALAAVARLAEPQLLETLAQPLNDDVSRVRVTVFNDLSLYGLLSSPSLPYTYDFAYNFMSPQDRDSVRGVIAKLTYGRLWLGARLPHHWRNWNWIGCGMAQPLLALAIEGEEGYDPRIFKLAVQMAHDYLTYGVTENGMSTEAVGYSQFGLVWLNPFCVAAARRGDNLLVNSHHRAMVDWYLHSMEPNGRQWTSHGDGGDGPPAIWTLSLWHYFYPHDPKVNFLWRNCLHTEPKKAIDNPNVDALWQATQKTENPGPMEGIFHLIEPLLWATDTPTESHLVDIEDSASLNLSLTTFDPTRSSLITRSAWTPDAVTLQFECRTDSVSASHEHADRGNFTFFALGRSWAKESFRSVETRYHNCILVDGLGQGYWPGPGQWLGLREEAWGLVAACDAKPAYDWFFPKSILFDDPTASARFDFLRWASYRDEARDFFQNYVRVPRQLDRRPAIVSHFEGFDVGDPRMWDEDGWPTCLTHNTVQRAFRTLAFVRGEYPYALIVDDIQKDESERLYEWAMITGVDTEIAQIDGNDIILCDATARRDSDGLVRPAEGDRQLLVRILQLNDPALARNYTARPSVRLETFDKKDTLVAEMKDGALSGSRSFGLEKRLIIPSRSVAPDYKILLFPFRCGDTLPVTSWNTAKNVLTINKGSQREEVIFTKSSDGCSHLRLERVGQPPI